jgi:translation elongation factor P/translation initiation factor 5A
MQVELKEVKTGLKFHTRLRASETVERVRLDEPEAYDFLYR